MKRRMVIVAALFSLVVTGLFAVDSDFGALGAKDKTALSLEQMLTYAIQDEYLARAEYEAITERYGTVRPFNNIIGAEEQHIVLLRELFATYGLTVPEDTSGTLLVIPPDLKTALETGVQAEIDNIAMYESFLSEAAAAPLPADVSDVFERLKAASENHLRAFNNNLARYN